MKPRILYLNQVVLRPANVEIDRLVASIALSSKAVVEQPLLQIEKYENEVYKLMMLIQSEASGATIQQIMGSIKESLDKSRATKEERCGKLSKWINGIDTKNTYETAIQYRNDGTCEWVLGMPAFLEWKQVREAAEIVQGTNEPEEKKVESVTSGADAKLLWINGPAGFGKTFLSARVIQHLKETAISPVAYFFSVADNQMTRDPYAILRSWLTQILEQDERAIMVMEQAYKSRENEQHLTQAGLWKLFSSIGAAIEDCIFIIDGFDECTDIDTGVRYHRNDPRAYFLRDMLESLSETRSRVLVVSRNVPDIDEYLAHDSQYATTGVKRFEYNITASDTTEDVKKFSETIVNNKLAKKKEGLRQKIASEAAQRSEGMFLWIKLLEKEISSGQNEKQLTRTVKDMPSGISEAYSRELEKISKLPKDDREQALMILRWTLFAIRPLKVKELAEAIVVSGEDEFEAYPEDDLPDAWEEGAFVDEDYVHEMILGKCGSLLQLRSSNADVPLQDHTVHFVHFSVKEYLTNLHTMKDEPEYEQDQPWILKLGFKDADTEENRLSEICLRYLTLDVFDNELVSDVEKYPFLSYASWAWYFHSYQDKAAPPPHHIITKTHRAFDPDISSWKVWTPVMEVNLPDPVPQENPGNEGNESPSEDNNNDPTRDKISLDDIPNPIYYASLLGLTDVVKWLQEKGLDSSRGGGRFGFPLQAAVVRNNKEVVKNLITYNVNPSQQGGLFGAAITAAASLSNIEIVKILLEAGADINFANHRRWTALHFAANRGDRAIVQYLLDNGAEVNSEAEANITATALMLACYFGHTGTVSVLLKAGADVMQLQNGALEQAIISGHNEIIEMLLQTGRCDPNGLFSRNWGALHVTTNSPVLTKMLLEAGADPTLLDSSNWTALHYAGYHGNVDVIKILLEGGKIDASGCKPDKGDEVNHQVLTPVQLAAAQGHVDALKELCKQGADLNQPTWSGYTTLLVAVEYGHMELLNAVLDMNVKFDCILEDSSESVFDLAERLENQEVMRLLVQRGAFRSEGWYLIDRTSDEQCEALSSLRMLVYDGDSQSLTKSSTELSKLPPFALEELLRIATARNHLPAVKMILENGAKVNDKDCSHRTALHIAARNLYEDIAEYLIDKGGNSSLSVEDKTGSTPIDLAATHGMKAKNFIQRHMDDLALHILRRDSHLAALSRGKDSNEVSPDEITPTKTREVLQGVWSGHYEYMNWEQGKKEDFSFKVLKASGASDNAVADDKLSETFSSSVFTCGGQDIPGKFEIYGFVDETAVIWFVKLYHGSAMPGWLYRGKLAMTDGQLVMKGTWGRNRKLWYGKFQLKPGELSNKKPE